MRALLLGPVILVTLATLGCSPARVEHYYTVENAVTTTHDGVTAKLLYFKQSQRHFYATIRLANSGTEPLAMKRSGTDAATVLLRAEGSTHPAEAASSSTWTPWSGTVIQDNDQLALLQIAPGKSSDLSLRWEFPATMSTYYFDWSITLHGLTRGDGVVSDLVMNAPADR